MSLWWQNLLFETIPVTPVSVSHSPPPMDENVFLPLIPDFVWKQVKRLPGPGNPLPSNNPFYQCPNEQMDFLQFSIQTSSRSPWDRCMVLGYSDQSDIQTRGQSTSTILYGFPQHTLNGTLVPTQLDMTSGENRWLPVPSALVTCIVFRTCLQMVVIVQSLDPTLSPDSSVIYQDTYNALDTRLAQTAGPDRFFHVGVPVLSSLPFQSRIQVTSQGTLFLPFNWLHQKRTQFLTRGLKSPISWPAQLLFSYHQVLQTLQSPTGTKKSILNDITTDGLVTVLDYQQGFWDNPFVAWILFFLFLGVLIFLTHHLSQSPSTATATAISTKQKVEQKSM